MAKTRAQRKAEKRAREAEEQKRGGDRNLTQSHAQHDTQVPVSGDIAEIEAVEAGIGGRRLRSRPRDPRRAEVGPGSAPRRGQEGEGS